MKRIAVFTSGGDSPGMNAAIRAVVRTANFENIEVLGILHGYQGMIDNEFIKLEAASVANIIQRGGTILKTSRCAAFLTAEGQRQAFDNLQKNKIDGVVAIGGDGTFKGAEEFTNGYNIPFIGIPGTIDKDLFGTDYTLGYDTAVNTAMYAIDKIRDTAEAHERVFFVEVMGKDAGYIALYSGIATGAEAILIPETKTYLEDLYAHLSNDFRRKKMCHIIIVAEGDDAGGAMKIANYVKQKFPTIDSRVSILGHIQRGGAPTVNDRVLGSRSGYAAVEALLAGKNKIMIGIKNDLINEVPFTQALKEKSSVSEELLKMIAVLSS